jgi:hypothetical protein
MRLKLNPRPSLGLSKLHGGEMSVFGEPGHGKLSKLVPLPQACPEPTRHDTIHDFNLSRRTRLGAVD